MNESPRAKLEAERFQPLEKTAFHIQDIESEISVQIQIYR